jgi:hypothetical protein
MWMSGEEFQRQYHGFVTEDREQALQTLARIDCEEPVVVVRLVDQYCLMLERSAAAVIALGIGEQVRPE